MCEYPSAGTCRAQQRAPHLLELELELQVDVDDLPWGLGTVLCENHTSS